MLQLFLSIGLPFFTAQKDKLYFIKQYVLVIREHTRIE
jgi:hypothetical protein